MEYKSLYISFVPDCDVNEGGYYCQVYSDKDMEYQVDDFCIHPEELAANPDIEYWIRQNVDGVVAAFKLRENPSLNKASLDSQIKFASNRIVNIQTGVSANQPER